MNEREGATGARTGKGDERGHEPALVRHEEELELGTRLSEAGLLRARKRVEREHVDQVFQRQVEQADELERTGVQEGDSGQIETLPDGSVSIPVFEERLVVTKELVVRERVVLRKRTVTEEQRVEAELRKERVDIETEGLAGEELER